jgi:hypothetical protein
MTAGYSLGLNASGSSSGTVTLYTGVPAPDPGGLDIEVVPDPSVFYLSVNGGAVAAPAPLHIPARDQRGTFTVALNVAGLPHLVPPNFLQTKVTIKAKGYAQSVVGVTIEP